MVITQPVDFTHDGPGTPAAAWRSHPAWARIAEAPIGIGATPGPRPDRVVVVAAHPDDESLGAGGLISRLHRAGVPVTGVVATAGEGSHPGSPTLDGSALATRRRAEAASAWAELGGRSEELHLWDLPDGGLADRRDELLDRLVGVVGDGRRTLLLTPWRHDGHPDHEALGEVGRQAAYRCGAELLQFPIWFWHHAAVSAAPWPQLTRVVLPPADRDRKRRAIASHTTQVAPLSAEPGDETLLGPAFLQHFEGPDEVFVVEAPHDDALDRLHHEHTDPWGTESRWYEERKRDLLLALLPRRRFDRALDVGCSTGTLTAALAGRCRQLIAIDRSAHAVEAARARLAGVEGDATVDVHQMDAPREWPASRFDLVVISESGYFLSPAGLDLLVERVSGSLTSDGVVVLAHWRHPLDGWPLSGPVVHQAFDRATALPAAAARYADRDVELVLHGPSHALPDPGRDG